MAVLHATTCLWLVHTMNKLKLIADIYATRSTLTIHDRFGYWYIEAGKDSPSWKLYEVPQGHGEPQHVKDFSCLIDAINYTGYQLT